MQCMPPKHMCETLHARFPLDEANEWGKDGKSTTLNLLRCGSIFPILSNFITSHKIPIPIKSIVALYPKCCRFTSRYIPKCFHQSEVLFITRQGSKTTSQETVKERLGSLLRHITREKYGQQRNSDDSVGYFYSQKIGISFGYNRHKRTPPETSSRHKRKVVFATCLWDGQVTKESQVGLKLSGSSGSVHLPWWILRSHHPPTCWHQDDHEDLSRVF